MSHFIDAETPYLREATRELIWQDAITEEYQYILRMMHKILFRNQKGKFVVNSKRIYMIKLATNESIKKYKT